MSNLFSFTEGFYPSEWFALGCVMVLIPSLILFIICGTIAKIRLKKGIESSKAFGIFSMIVMGLLCISMMYALILATGRISILFIFAIMKAVMKIKPNMGHFKQIGVCILIGLLLYSPVLIFLGLDEIVEDKVYQAEQEAYKQMAERISQTEIAEGVTLNDVVLSYEDVNETYWSASYYEYDNTWRISVDAKYKPEDDYHREEVIYIKFIYTEEDNKLTLDEIKIYDRETEEYDYTTYSKNESQKMFNQMVEEALK